MTVPKELNQPDASHFGFSKFDRSQILATTHFNRHELFIKLFIGLA